MNSHNRVSAFLFSVLIASMASAAYADNLHVANNGVDAAECGSRDQPCRTINRAIANASTDDTIIVGPGVYGDYTGETASGPCFSCMLSVSKSVTIISRDGASATVIDATRSNTEFNVVIFTGGDGGGVFGRPGHGFTITNTAFGFGAQPFNFGVEVDSPNWSVEGNRVISPSALGRGSVGITVASTHTLVRGNDVSGWETGISSLFGNSVVSENVVTLNRFGISVSKQATDAFAGLAIENVVTANTLFGLVLSDSAQAIKNSVVGNGTGILSRSATATIDMNNIFGNTTCGVRNNALDVLTSINNYWGAATGPGAAPANDVCGPGGAVLTTPFATEPFDISVRVKR